jgi:hypothetical protein
MIALTDTSLPPTKSVTRAIFVAPLSHLAAVCEVYPSGFKFSFGKSVLPRLIASARQRSGGRISHTGGLIVEPQEFWAYQRGIIVAIKKELMTMNRAITILRESGWVVDVDKVSRRIVLRDPLPDVNWLHVLRNGGMPKEESIGRSVDDTVFPVRRNTR